MQGPPSSGCLSRMDGEDNSIVETVDRIIFNGVH